MTDHHSREELFDWDEFDERLTRCTPADPPANLRAGILAQVPHQAQANGRSVAANHSRTNRGRPTSRRWLGNCSLRYVTAASLAVLAFALFFLNRTETPVAAEPWDMLVSAAQASAEVDALHVTSFLRYDNEAFNQRLGVQDTWWLRNVGVARITKNRAGELSSAWLMRPTVKEHYRADDNEYVIEPIIGNEWDFAPQTIWFDMDDEQNFTARVFKKASEEEIAIDITELEIDGRQVKRMSVSDVNFGTPETLEDLIYSVEVEIEVSTNHILRMRSHERRVRKPGTEQYFGKDDLPRNSTHERLFEYPDPSRFDLSVFSLPIPPGAVMRRLEYPAWILRDRDKLLVIGVFVTQYVGKSNRESDGDPSFPNDFVEALSAMENFPSWYLHPGAAFGGVDRSKSYWTFFHAGEKLYDLVEEGELLTSMERRLVIAERRYDTGHVLQLFADGHTRIVPPANETEADK